MPLVWKYFPKCKMQHTNYKLADKFGSITSANSHETSNCYKALGTCSVYNPINK